MVLFYVKLNFIITIKFSLNFILVKEVIWYTHFGNKYSHLITW